MHLSVYNVSCNDIFPLKSFDVNILILFDFVFKNFNETKKKKKGVIENTLFKVINVLKYRVMNNTNAKY